MASMATWFAINGTFVHPLIMLEAPSTPIATHEPAPEIVDVSVMVPSAVVTFTERLLPLWVAVTAGGAGLGLTSNCCRSWIICARLHSHCALVLRVVPSCILNGFGN